MTPAPEKTTLPPETIIEDANGKEGKPDSYDEKDSGTDESEDLPKKSLKFTEGNDTAQESNKDVPHLNRLPSAVDTSHQQRPRGDETHDENDDGADEEQDPPLVNNSWLSRRTHDIVLLILLISMLAWPWIFWGAVRASKGVQMDNRTAKLVRDHPHTTTFIVTFIGNLITIIIDILFSLSVIRLAQEWFGKKRREPSGRVTVFHVQMLAGVRNQRWPWNMGDLRRMVSKSGKWLPLVLLGTCISAFAFVPPSATSLLTPVPYNKTASLSGNELDFSSTAPDCLAWFGANDLSNNCDWKFFKNVSYTTCLGENQMVDVLESGRGNILSLLSNNTESLTLSQLGSTDGIRFLGPVGGVLPMGPDGVPSFDTTFPTSPFASEELRAGMIAYNYTLEHQGLTSNITCKYDSQSPIRAGVTTQNTTLAYQYNATCSDLGQVEVLRDVKTFVSVNANNSLAFWACQSPPVQDLLPTYYVYLRGRTGAYRSTFGSMTCTVSPIQPAVYPLTYFSESRIFQLSAAIQTAPSVLPRMIEHALVGLGAIVHQAQNWETNLVAESIITFAVKSFSIKEPYQQLDQYLRLTEAMLKGILEYEATYIRLVYSTKMDSAPASCLRSVGGEASFTVLGWRSTIEQIGLIMPMTLITLTAIIIVMMAMGTAVNDNEYNAGDLLAAQPLLSAAIKHAPPPEAGEDGEGEEQESWEDVVTFSRVQARQQAVDRDNQQDLPWFSVVKEWLGLNSN